MYAALRCLEEHDLKLVGWALVVCLASMVVGANAYHRAMTVTGAQRWIWISLAAVILGSGVWATHFIAMLGFQPDLRLSFEGSQTALSFVAILIGMMCAMSVAIEAQGPTLRAVGGAICGISIAAMHFLGVSAMRLPAVMIWSPHIVAAAIAFSVVFSAVAFRDLTRDAGFGRRLFCALTLSVAVGALHFIGMAAVTLVPAELPDTVGRFARGELAQMVGVIVVIVVLAGCAMLATFGLASRSAFGVLRSALNHAPVGLAYFSRDGLLQVWTETLTDFARPHGLTPAHGMSLAEIGAGFAGGGKSPWDVQAVREAIGGDGVTPDVFVSPGGRFLAPKLTQTQDGGFLLILADATEQVAATEREAEARRLAEHASRAKSRVLPDVDLEIRGPLHGIADMAQALEREARDESLRDRLHGIVTSSGAVLARLDRVLEISRIAAGEADLQDAPRDASVEEPDADALAGDR